MPMVTVECPLNPIPNVHVCGMWEETRVPGGELTHTKEKHKNSAVTVILLYGKSTHQPPTAWPPQVCYF